MKTLQDLRELAELLPPGGAVTLPREALLAVLGNGAVHTCAESAPAPGDLTIAELAAHFRRSTSTVRAWVEAGQFPGSYHLPASGKLMTFTKGPQKGEQRARVGAWRIPRAAVDRFVATHRNGGS